MGWSGGLADTDTDKDDGDNINNDDHGDSWQNGITQKRLGDAGPQNSPINSSSLLRATRAPTNSIPRQKLNSCGADVHRPRRTGRGQTPLPAPLFSIERHSSPLSSPSPDGQRALTPEMQCESGTGARQTRHRLRTKRCWDNKPLVSPRGAQPPSEKVCQRLAKPARGWEFRAISLVTMVWRASRQPWF